MDPDQNETNKKVALLLFYFLFNKTTVSKLIFAMDWFWSEALKQKVNKSTNQQIIAH